ncbi:cytochrome c oxidase assembly factor CtaG [Shouchella shacheensis]|uniref:cytochrome c oxidase assembly factor CtaG n=1 Tax=Shouchella shacheensis TaxID=1649580 RepID=UPI00073FE6FD|nr:cytochrome c oxidase assembly factor CtaG [Shouchella shacheensis]
METLFDSLGFRALWTPELLVLLIVVYMAYIGMIHKVGRRLGVQVPLTIGRLTLFGLGLFALYLGWGSPLYVTGHVMMTIHMLQMICAYFVAIPLLLLGIPKWALEAMVSNYKGTRLARAVHVLWNPILALLLFNGLFSFYHVPFIFDTLMQSPFLHSGYQWILLGSATLMWWHMLAPLPSGYQLPDLRRIFYIFANGLLITPACALIIFAPNAMYQTYTDPAFWSQVMAYCLPAGVGPEMIAAAFGSPQSLSLLDARMDQQLAGVMMKIFQEIVYGITVGYVFKQWLKKEKFQEGELSISDIPDSLNIEDMKR